MSEHDGADEDSGDRGAEREDGEGPGGGPKRVVSNTSVDHILDSLNETNAGDSSAGSTGGTRAQSEPSADSRGELEDEASREEVEEAGAENAEGNDGGAETEQAQNDKPTASAPTQDDLSSRIERGAVTGADVRAAEAGDGRERTPDIDEIDLSLDDLETSQASESAASGPAASSPSDRVDSAPSNDETDDRAGPNGLLARLRDLFSW